MIRRSLWLLVPFIIAIASTWQSLAGDEPPPSAGHTSILFRVDETRCFRHDNGFCINTPDAEDKATDCQVGYPSCVHPLRQYFLQLTGAHLHCSGVQHA